MKLVDLSGRRILVIDDYELVLQSVCDMLAVMGASILEARTGHTGLALAREHLPDLVLSNHSMPEMEGLEVLEAIRGDDRTAHLPFILMSGVASPDLHAECLRRGADAYLDKSTGLNELAEAVADVLERDRRRRST